VRLILFILVLMVSGCGSTRDETATHVRQDSYTKNSVATKSAPDEAGQMAVVEIIETVETLAANGQTKTDSHVVTQIPLPPILAAIPKIIGAAASVTPFGAIAASGLAVITALTGAYATSASSRAAAEKRRADEQQRDAEEGWALAHATALKVPPKAES